jgi:hypothetical protein
MEAQIMKPRARRTYIAIVNNDDRNPIEDIRAYDAPEAKNGHGPLHQGPHRT